MKIPSITLPPTTDFKKPIRKRLFAFRATHESKLAAGGLLLLLLMAVNLCGQARAPKPKQAAVTFHYYGVQKMTGALQWLASSTDPNFFGKTYGGGESATELFNAFAIVYRCPSKLTAANLIWRDDHGQPGIRWNQHVEVPSGPPMPTRQWSRPMPAFAPKPYTTTNLDLPPLPGASVVPDTQPPVVSFAMACSAITNFPTHVYCSFTRVGGGWWTDPESGQNASQIFDVQFPVQSNNYYTAWSSNNLTDWMEYPTPLSLHPARVNATNGMYFPILTNGHKFFTLRSYVGGTRTTWQ